MTGIYIISTAQAGQRLDVALADFFPGLSLREVRRAWGLYLVELNGKHARKGSFVQLGDVISITALPQENIVNNTAGKIDERGVSELTAGGQESRAPDYSEMEELPVLDQNGQADRLQSYPEPDLTTVRILNRKNGIIALFKPAGLHSASLKGGGLSLEQLLPELCVRENIDPCELNLFNRLDCLTTGIVLACENKVAQESCLQAEKRGELEKRYLALVRGNVFGEFWIKNGLDTDSRRKTKVLPSMDPDPLRHTLVRPIHLFSNLSDFIAPNVFSALSSKQKEEQANVNRASENVAIAEQTSEQISEQKNAQISSQAGEQQVKQKACLLEVTIFRGARHQIRAHLASAGFPILGDPVYDPDYQKIWGGLYLHHFAVALPGFLAITPPPWQIGALHAAGNNSLARVIRGIYPGIYDFI